MRGDADPAPPSVLFVACDPPGHATYRYRNAHLAEALRAAGWRADVAYVGQPRVEVAHDVVVLHRVCDVPEGRAFARSARACGAALVYSADDLVFDADAFPSDGGPVYDRLRAFAPRHQAMLVRADAALVSTEYLAGAVREAAPGKPVAVVRNFLNPELARLSDAAARGGAPSPGEAGDRRLLLGYLSGSSTHDADLAGIAEPLARVLARHDRADLLLVGPVALPAPLAPFEAAGRVRRHPFVAWRDLPGVLASVDVNLAPLDLSRPYNRAKSEIKWLEAAAVGVPTVATAPAGFREFLEGDGSGAAASSFLAATPEEWEARVADLLANADARARLAAAARGLAARRGTDAAHADAVRRAFAGFAALSAPGVAPGAVRSRRRVNYPLPPAKYAVKALLARWRRG